MWRILQHNKAEDFVFATGETHTIREFTEVAFSELGIELEWQGEGVDEKGTISAIDKSKLEELNQSSIHPINLFLLTLLLFLSIHPITARQR
ncbi:MAG: GDP-mannose 4,6-dehydratase [Melioribacteraceae bacterium]|nr:GDP-mannose 4,6-dehydratase [Melioribacteraceae bacterium]